MCSVHPLMEKVLGMAKGCVNQIEQPSVWCQIRYFFEGANNMEHMPLMMEDVHASSGPR